MFPARLNIMGISGPAVSAGPSFAAKAATDSFAMAPDFAAGVGAVADREYSSHISGIFRAPIGDAKFKGVPLGMPSDESKVIFDPESSEAIAEPKPASDIAVSDPTVEGAPEAVYAVDVVPIVAGIFISIIIFSGLYGNYVDNKLARAMKWKTDNIDRRRISDFERAMKGEDPFAKNVAELKRKIRNGKDDSVAMNGSYELWDDSVRALIEVLVEDRETRIPPNGSERRRRLNAIAEVKHLLRSESPQIFKSPWFPRVNEHAGLFLFKTVYDNVEELKQVARARLMTLEKAAESNGKMDWAKGAAEELRIIDPDKFSNVHSIAV